jgi:hypothetical protein
MRIARMDPSLRIPGADFTGLRTTDREWLLLLRCWPDREKPRVGPAGTEEGGVENVVGSFYRVVRISRGRRASGPA